MKTLEEIINQLSCSEEVANQILSIQSLGYEHGKKGWYKSGNFRGSNEWLIKYSNGIDELEIKLNLTDSPIYNLYAASHSEGLVEYELDAEDNWQAGKANKGQLKKFSNYDD